MSEPLAFGSDRPSTTRHRPRRRRAGPAPESPPVSRRTDPPLPDAGARITFGPFVLDGPAGRLLRDGAPVELAPRPFALLAYLAARPGQLVGKDELLDAVWGHRFVSDSALKVAVNALRSALGEDARAPRWIETAARRGYRFAAAASSVPPAPAPVFVAAPVEARAIDDADLFGRAADAQALRQALAAGAPILTLLGPGGVGKTRLALAVAADAAPPDGVHWLRLDALSQPSQIGPALARTLGLAAEAARDTASLARALAPWRARLVLDNAEHLLDGSAHDLAAQLTVWAAAAPAVQWLLTSQRPLRVARERVLALAPLAEPAALALFVARVRSHQAGWAPDEAALQDARAIVRTLDGLPLQLELAAARVPLLGTAGVRQRLDERLQLLARGRADAPDRQRTLRAALDWSVSLLPASARRLLARLSVFAGGFSVDAAQAVADAGPWAVLDDLEHLREMALVVPLETGPSPTPAGAETLPRLRLYDSVRLHAAEALATDGQADMARDAHLAWMLSVFEAADARLMDLGEERWLAPLLPEADNLQAAMAHALDRAAAGEAAAAARLVGCSVSFCLRAGLKLTAQAWLQALASSTAAAGLAPALQASLLAARALLGSLGQLAPPQQALADARAAAAVLDAAGQPRRAFYLQFHVAMLHSRLQDAKATAEAHQMLCARLPADATLYERRLPAWVAACIARDAGDAVAYRDFWADMLAQSRALGDRVEAWRAAWGLGQALTLQGDDEAALQVLDRAVDEIRSAGRLHAFAALAAQAALLHAARDATAPTLARLHEAIRLLQGQGQVWWLADALPWVPLHQGRGRDARRLMDWADALVRGRGEARGPVFARLRDAFERRCTVAPAPDRAPADEPSALALAFAAPDGDAVLSAQPARA